MQEQVGQKGCTTSCAPLLPTISLPTISVIGVLLQILSASYYDDASTSHGQPSQPSQPLSVSRVLLPFPLLGSPPPLNRCVLGWGWYLPFHAVDDDTSCSSSLLSVACTQHAQLSIVCMLLISECPISSCSWIGDCDSKGISIFVCERMHHSSPLLCTLAIHFRCCFNFLFVVFFALAATFNMLYR